MENPFLRNFVKSRPRFFDTTATARTPRGIPVHQSPTATTTTTTTTTSPKVVSIPVHFVGSEETRSKAALRIQKVFRGYRVRKNVKKIAAIKQEVDEIEKKISLKETVDLIRNEDKERLKVNEMLMALLFRLDSVGGFDFGVRDCRRAVTKKAIMLQERLDAIVSGDPQTLGEGEGEDSVVEDQTLTLSEDSVVEDEAKDLSNSLVEGGVEQSEENFKVGIEEKNVAEEEEEEVVNKECLQEVSEEETVEKKDGQEEDAMEIEKPGVIQGIEEEEEGIEKVEGAKERGDADDRELMEKMIEKNEMLIGMVADLCERNTVQSQLINSLSKRVDNLEKALSKCRKRRKVASRKAAPATC